MATNTIFSRRFPLADAMFPPLTEGYMKELDARRSAWVNSMKYYEERLYSMLHERDRLILRYFHASPFVPGYLSDNRIAFRDNPGSFENLAQLDTQFYADLRAWQRARYVLHYIFYASNHVEKCRTEEIEITILLEHCAVVDLIMEDIRNLGTPPACVPAPTRPDDRERIHDRNIFIDDPNSNLAMMIKSADPDTQMRMQSVVEEHRAELPAFPHFLQDLRHPSAAERRLEPAGYDYECTPLIPAVRLAKL